MNTITNNLKNKIKNIPNLPGVYKMIDSTGLIIYIGKSISLRKRVMSYFTKSTKWGRIERMVELIDDIEYELTDTHIEARLLECELIKKIQPLYNSQYKNHNKYLYLKVNDYNIHNPLSVSYSRVENSFGPYRNRSGIRALVDSLKNIYPIKKVHGKYKISYNLIPKSMDKFTFNINKNILLEILTDNRKLKEFIYEVEKKMKEESSHLKFETAFYYRNIITWLDYIYNSEFNKKNMLTRDIVLGLPIDGGIKLFYIKKGLIVSKEKHEKINQMIINDFIKRSETIKLDYDVNIYEKGILDFQDILFSEIKTLPEESVLIRRD